jgi:hypothetical protein
MFGTMTAKMEWPEKGYRKQRVMHSVRHTVVYLFSTIRTPLEIRTLIMGHAEHASVGGKVSGLDHGQEFDAQQLLVRDRTGPLGVVSVLASRTGTGFFRQLYHRRTDHDLRLGTRSEDVAIGQLQRVNAASDRDRDKNIAHGDGAGDEGHIQNFQWLKWHGERLFRPALQASIFRYSLPLFPMTPRYCRVIGGAPRPLARAIRFADWTR